MEVSKYPKIYLALDNCVFYKRWTTPDEWSEKTRDLGIRYIEASADTEHDPVYMGKVPFEEWTDEVREAEQKYGVKVANLYSGHGTYTTLGLTHPDPRVREHMLENWFFPMVDTAGKLGCGLGFFAHAFPHAELQSEERYNENIKILIDSLLSLGSHAAGTGCREIGLEQMYTPHQYPWRIRDMIYLMGTIKEQSGHDFYFTEDLGHHHIKFMRPGKNDFLKASYPNLWVGTDRAFELWKQKGAEAWEEIEADMDKNPQLFSEEKDGDCYTWLETLGCYSPIVHLQQTNGLQSSHLPFTKENNDAGKIHPVNVLKAIKKAYDAPEDEKLPKRCKDIYLTFELFSGTTSNMTQVMEDYAESIRYWRQFIPEDGMDLNELIEKNQ